AEDHIAKIGTAIPHLGISFAEIAKDMKVVIDEDALPVEKAGDVSLDPGSHHITVSAPGRVAYQTTVTVDASKPTSITVPKLGYPVTVKSTRKPVGKIMTTAGAVMLGTSVVLGFVAKKQYDDEFKGAMPHCMKVAGGKPMCNADGYQATGNARTLGNVGTVIA